MKLTVWQPTQVVLEKEVDRIKAEAGNGWFELLPRHVDFVAALIPGVMTIQRSGEPEEYLAIDQGILVKCGAEVSVSTRNAVHGIDLARLREEVEIRFRARQEREKAASTYEAKLEADLVRRLMEVEKHA